MKEMIIDLITGETRIVEMNQEQIAELDTMREAEQTLAQQIEAVLSKQRNTQLMTEALWDEFRPYLASILAGTPQEMTFGEMMTKVAVRYLAEGGEV